MFLIIVAVLLIIFSFFWQRKKHAQKLRNLVKTELQKYNLKLIEVEESEVTDTGKLKFENSTGFKPTILINGRPNGRVLYYRNIKFKNNEGEVFRSIVEAQVSVMFGSKVSFEESFYKKFVKAEENDTV